MQELKKRIYENGLEYELVGDYYLPILQLPEESRHIGKWGMMHREYLKKRNPILFNELLLNGELWSYLTQLNEQADARYKLIIKQMMDNEGVTEELKRKSQMEWVRAVNNIINRAEEIIKSEFIYV